MGLVNKTFLYWKQKMAASIWRHMLSEYISSSAEHLKLSPSSDLLTRILVLNFSLWSYNTGSLQCYYFLWAQWHMVVKALRLLILRDRRYFSNLAVLQPQNIAGSSKTFQLCKHQLQNLTFLMGVEYYYLGHSWYIPDTVSLSLTDW